LDEQFLRKRFNHKQVQRTYVDTVSTSCAGINMHRGEVFPIHGDRIERAYFLTVAQSKTTPGTSTPPTIHDNRTSARGDTLVPGQAFDEPFATSTFETSDSFLFRPNVHAEQFGNLDQSFFATDRAFARAGLSFH
jgi:hypothetical protein